VAAAQARARETAAPVPASEAGPAAPAPAGAPSVSAPEPGLSLAEQIARAEVSLGQEPSLRACRDLARLYLTAQRFSDAIRTLRQAVERPDFDDSGLADDLTVAYRGQADAAVATWKQCAREHPDRAAEAEREASAAIQERDRLLLELQRGQAARHPRDSRRRLELAEMLLARGEWSEALEHFAAARNHPNLKWRALAGMGRCQLNQGVAAEAVVSLRQALDAGVTGPLRDRLAVMYDLAIACERTGRVEEANALLKDIFAQDRTFKDVGERIRRLAETPVPPAAPRRQ
jgi:tetratricopeptide (TPR) repeat protein